MHDLMFLKTIDDIDYLIYHPSLLHLYSNVYPKENIPPYYSRSIHHIRMIRELIFAKYQVIYMRQDGQIVGHLVVSRGGTRIAVSTKEDIVIGPIWIIPSKRSLGLGEKGINSVLHDLGFSYHYAYEYIESDNIASIKTVEKNGFICLGRYKEYGILKTIKENRNGKYYVFRY